MTEKGGVLQWYKTRTHQEAANQKNQGSDNGEGQVRVIATVRSVPSCGPPNATPSPVVFMKC